jgi:hypothetical protein
MMSKYPVAGIAWMTLHYLVGLQRLGCDVYYVEAHAVAPTMLLETESDDPSANAVAYISKLMQRTAARASDRRPNRVHRYGPGRAPIGVADWANADDRVSRRSFSVLYVCRELWTTRLSVARLGQVCLLADATAGGSRLMGEERTTRAALYDRR